MQSPQIPVEVDDVMAMQLHLCGQLRLLRDVCFLQCGETQSLEVHTWALSGVCPVLHNLGQF